MNFDPKHVRRALMVAKDLATSIDPGFANIQPPMPPEGVPLERAKGGEVKNVMPVGSPERSENLRQWLGNSFLHVDGNPKTYYHGTSKDKPFTGFKVGRHGAWFTSDPKDASMYAQQNDSMSSRYEGGRFVPQNTASRVMPVFLKADNPFFGEFPEKYKNVENYKKAQSDWFDELRAKGHDSWIPRSQEGNLAVMLEGPHQVKSAVGNVGTFDPANPDITKAEGGSVDDHPDQGYAPKPPGVLDVDNPGGDWLKENREYSESRGYLPSGAPKSFGKTTAVWRELNSNEIAPVYLPVRMLAQLPGVMGEQKNVRSHDLDWLVDHMGKTGKLPKIDGREYKPFITVDHRGMPFVSEGNHRIMAAAKLGWDYLPVEVRYFNGAENVDGPLHPDRIREMHGVRNTNDAGINVKTPIAEPEKAVRRALMIAKAAGGSAEKPPKVRKTATDFLPESLPDVSINSLTKAFTEGINEHLSLPEKERIQNSRAAKKVIASRNGSGALLAKNGKLMKTETGAGDSDPVELPDGRGIETTGLSLAPAFQAGKFNTCPNHASCKASCLGVTSGGNFMFGGGRDLEEMKGPRLAHLKNTLAMILHPKEFAVRLNDEITAAKQQAAVNGNKLGVRLNVLSDIHPRAYEALIKAHPDVDFYDYTKLDSNPIAPNHHLTYSSTGVAQPAGVNGNSTDVDNEHQNWRRMRRRLDTGSNVAMAFSHGSVLPEFVHDLESGKKYRVVNGDDHDFRPMDRQAQGADGVIVGLKNKKAFGKEQEAHIDSNGFFTYYDPKIVKDPMGNNVVTNNTVQVAPQPGARRMMTNDSLPEGNQNG